MAHHSSRLGTEPQRLQAKAHRSALVQVHRSTLVFCALPLLLLSSLSSCTKDPRPLPVVPDQAQRADTKEGHPSLSLDWSYEGEAGPDHWAALKSEWTPCQGEGQSPVDLPLDALKEGPKATSGATASPLTGPLVPQFADLPLEASSDGRLVTLLGAGAQGLSIDGRLAPLKSLEIHSPAEHKLGGISADLELVLWLKDATLGDVALSLLFRKGAENPHLQDLVAALPEERVYERKILGKRLSLPPLLAPEATLLSYPGSASTPPCQTGVTRLVLAYMGEISEAQLSTLKGVLPGPSQRPVQPLGDRPVTALAFASAPHLDSSAEKNP